MIQSVYRMKDAYDFRTQAMEPLGWSDFSLLISTGHSEKSHLVLDTKETVAFIGLR
ncbi:hypothetical protein [Coxiella endosymbiont of Ornithodoros amblus]|uniref:hypothetical protein n=1 Tax=Coxiella endosymbiont of Ornithodoros amblus TaxID=1656166 RepID=UPI00244E057A|nr:hypothetical protein [Coxiella endosymbiont of Ornithodoros amblus]